MCGRYDFSGLKHLSLIQAVGSLPANVKHGEICPGDTAAVLSRSRKLEASVFAMRWGYLVPDGKLLFNARSETAAEKPMFRDGMQQRRCLIPADRYFEWEHTGSRKQKYEIRPRHGDGFFLAGIYRLEGSVPAFTVLTRSPAENIAFIHHRMPVIIPDDCVADWLDPRNSVQELLQQAVAEVVFEAVK